MPTVWRTSSRGRRRPHDPDAYAAGEMKHGPIALISKGARVSNRVRLRRVDHVRVAGPGLFVCVATKAGLRGPTEPKRPSPTRPTRSCRHGRSRA